MPQLVTSIEQATNVPSNELVTRLNMDDGTKIYFVETIVNGKKTIVIEKIGEDDKWISSVKATEIGDGTYEMLFDTQKILDTFGSKDSEYGNLNFHYVDEVTSDENSQADETTIVSPSETSINPTQHIWKQTIKPNPTKAFVEQTEDAINVRYGNVNMEMSASDIRGLSGVLTSSKDDSSFPWWTLSFIAVVPMFGAIWFFLRKRRKKQKIIKINQF